MKSLERQLRYLLAAGLALVLVILLAIANLSTRSMLEEFVTSRLEHDAVNILAALDLFDEAQNSANPLKRLRWRRINPIYNLPASGHYYTIRIGNRVLRSPSLQEAQLPEPASLSNAIMRGVAGPNDQRLIMWSKQFDKEGQSITVSVAEDMSLLKERRERFKWLFVFMGIIGIVLMLFMQRLIIRRLFRQLDETRHEVRQIESGQRQLLNENVPVEIDPLVREFNHILSLMQQRLERSRNALGNLAHALKTPLSILMQNLEDENRETKHNQQARQQVERIRQLTERELKRARLAGTGQTPERFNAREELSVLCDVLKQAHGKGSSRENFRIDLVIDPAVPLFGDREDMLELFGNLLDNACKWAKSAVACRIEMHKHNVVVTIEDDGKGQPPEALDQLAQRGVRLDETVEGHGLGLAICKDIVKLYGGKIHFGRSSSLGGFQVEVSLPQA